MTVRSEDAAQPEAKYLTLVSPVLPSVTYDEAKNLERQGRIPRRSIYQDVVGSDIFDGSWFSRIPRFRRMLYRPLPPKVSQIIEAYIIRRRYRVVISWSEFAAALYALLLKVTRSKSVHVALLYWMSLPKVARLLRWGHSHIDRIITWSSVQRDFAVRTLGVPPEKIVLIRHFVDEKFWRPEACETTMICSAGREMRDFPTLIEAMRGLDIRCHIATGDLRGYMEPAVRAIYEHGAIPQNITVGKLEPTELRALYARARFVVVPLLHSDTDNGISVILEAMAMGKAVICSRTVGQVDVIQEGRTGILVPPRDVDSLRRAILSLWTEPDLAARMGRAGRDYIERYHTLDQFIQSVKDAIDGVAASKRAGADRPVSFRGNT